MKKASNEKLLDYIYKKEKAYEKYSNELNELNYEYTPIMTKLHKKKSNLFYVLGLTVFAILFITIFVILYDRRFPESFLYIVYSIAALTLGYMVYIIIKLLKEITLNNNERETKYKIISKHLDEGNKYLALASKEVFKLICDNNNYDVIIKKQQELSTVEFARFYEGLLSHETEKILNEIGGKVTDEQILTYYYSWGKKTTLEEKEDYQSFLEGRRKRHLG